MAVDGVRGADDVLHANCSGRMVFVADSSRKGESKGKSVSAVMYITVTAFTRALV